MNETDLPPGNALWKVWLGLTASIVFIAFGIILGGEWAQIAGSAWEVLPFVALAVLAYLGVGRLWAKALTFAALIVILGLAALVTVVLVLLFELERPTESPPTHEGPQDRNAQDGWKRAGLSPRA